MSKIYTIIISCIFFICVARSMEIAQEQRDLFSEQPNHIRRKFIFPLLDECQHVTDTRIPLLSIGLVSKKSYNQINCPFFTRDLIKFLSLQHDLPHGNVAHQLNTYASKQYKLMGTELILSTFITSPDLQRYSAINQLIQQGADINYRSFTFGTTVLMKAVALNYPKLVYSLLQQKADQNACNEEGTYVRNFNLIYNKDALDKIFVAITNCIIKSQHPTKKIKDDAYHDYRRVSDRILKALFIERMFEDAHATSSLKGIHNPLIFLLKTKPYSRHLLLSLLKHSRQKNIPLRIPYCVQIDFDQFIR